MFNIYYKERVIELINNNKKYGCFKVRYEEFLKCNIINKICSYNVSECTEALKVFFSNEKFRESKLIAPSNQHKVNMSDRFDINEENIMVLYYPFDKNEIIYDLKVSRTYVKNRFFLYDKFIIISPTLDRRDIIYRINTIIENDREHMVYIVLNNKNVQNVQREILEDIDSLSLEERIFFLNLDNYSDLIHLINSAEVVISLSEVETLDIILIEALRMGKKIICSPTLINYEMLEDYPIYYTDDITLNSALNLETINNEERNYILNKFYNKDIFSDYCIL